MFLPKYFTKGAKNVRFVKQNVKLVELPFNMKIHSTEFLFHDSGHLFVKMSINNSKLPKNCSSSVMM